MTKLPSVILSNNECIERQIQVTEAEEDEK